MGLRVRNDCARYVRLIAGEHNFPLNTVESVIKEYLTRMGTSGLTGFEFDTDTIRNSGKTYIQDISEALNIHRTTTETIVRDYLSLLGKGMYRLLDQGVTYAELVLDGVCKIKWDRPTAGDFPSVRGRVDEAFKARLTDSLAKRKLKDPTPFAYEERIVIDGICTITIYVDSEREEPLVRGRVSAAFKERMYAAV